MKILGITGGSGSGKSQVGAILKEEGVFVIDADIVARKVVAKGQKGLKEIVDYFGQDILLKTGELDRKKLGGIVFSDAKKLGILNEITHKYIMEETKQIIAQSSAKCIAIEAAVLIESEMAKLCDKIIFVLSDRQNRIVRITKRDGLTEEQAKMRIDAQKSDEFYIRNSDFVIYNNGNIKELKKQVLQYKEKICV